MKTLASMTPADVAEYMALMGRATAEVVPPDGLFCLIIFDGNGKANYVSNCNRLNIPTALRELAQQLEAKMAQTN